MLLKLGWNQFKLEYYNLSMLNVIPRVTTKKTPTGYTQKGKRKEFKFFTIKAN